MSTLNDNVLNSLAVQNKASTDTGITFFLRHFPKDRQLIWPIRPGTARLRVLASVFSKFFFDGDFVIPNPVVPSSDGLSLLGYTGGEGRGTPHLVNGELNKLANNVSFGHGIHSGTPWAQRHGLIHKTGRGAGD